MKFFCHNFVGHDFWRTLFFVSHYFLSVTILKNPYKTKTNEARMLIFSVEGTYHRGSMSLLFGHSNPISLGVLTRLVRELGGGGTILKNPYKTKNYKGRKLFFSVEGTYHMGSVPLMFGHSNPISLGPRGEGVLYEFP